MHTDAAHTPRFGSLIPRWGKGVRRIREVGRQCPATGFSLYSAGLLPPPGESRAPDPEKGAEHPRLSHKPKGFGALYSGIRDQAPGRVLGAWFRGWGGRYRPALPAWTPETGGPGGSLYV